jgi:hypothetical protein
MTLEQIPPTCCGISSFLHQSSSPWTETPSPSNSRGSSLASARGLRQWRVVAAHVDSLFLARQQRRQWRVLTPKFGKESDLWVQLVQESVS